MKQFILILFFVGPVLSNLSHAEGLTDGHPKKGYNYNKHYRQGAVKHFFTRVFNLNNCYR